MNTISIIIIVALWLMASVPVYFLLSIGDLFSPTQSQSEKTKTKLLALAWPLLVFYVLFEMIRTAKKKHDEKYK